MALMRGRKQADICTGPLLRNIFRFALPIILSGALQMLFNAADTAVVGRFGSPTALASVGATSSLTHLIVNVFLGLSTGAGVAVAQGMGANDHGTVRRTVRTSALLSVVCGALVASIGVVFSAFFLRLMGTPDDVLRGAVLYMRIYFAGMPAIMLFNFGSSMLRSMGDTRRPLMFLTAAGVVNVTLNLLFVIALHMDVAGAALAGFLVLTVKPYIAQRFAAWGHVWSDPYGAGWQQTRALSAAAGGGLLGVGAGRGWLSGIFAADTDMVFCLVSEELGLIIALCAMLALTAICFFAVRSAANGRSSYYVIAACAASAMMLVQLALNVFGSTDLLPFTGVTFPFVSRGGSSLISCWMLLAFLKSADTRQNASFSVRLSARPRAAAKDEPGIEVEGSEEAGA